VATPTDPRDSGPGPLRRLIEGEAAGGILLLAAALVALVWANSGWGGSYRSLWHSPITFGLGRYSVEGDLSHWVNDALMVVFFFVVGLEIKREVVHGELRDPRTAAMPAIAAVGGMVVPALIFVLVNAGGEGARGWGIPMATDIAFAVGLVTLLGPRVPASLRLFLLTLAIVDDIGAIVVIGVFYSSGLKFGFLAGAVAVVVAIVALQRLGVVRLGPYAVMGVALWLVTYASGVHATIAGVALGLLTPASSRRRSRTVGELPIGRDQASPAERMSHLLGPWSTYVVVPVFALANAGVVISADAFDAPGTTAVSMGVILGLVAGKVLGVTGAAWLAARTGVGRLPGGTTWPMMFGISAVAGVGFTVSLFIAELAFAPGPLQEAAKLGVLAGSTIAAVIGGVALRGATGGRAAPAPA
jgi:NhaA family Na+:H+ antiporter